MRIRSRIAVWCARLAYAGIRILGRGNGSSFPGRVARYIDPDILSVMSSMVREKVIAVTGTNGKTTTNSILYHALKAEGAKVLYNSMGANLLDGVISAFVLAAGVSGRLDVDYACIEVDEMASVEVFPRLSPDCVLLTNLFRDQLDRTGEVELLCGRIRRALRDVPEAVLAVNGDDICSWTLRAGCENPVITYGIDERMDHDMPVGARESAFCPFCGRRLIYDFYQYGQLGKYRCPGCGMERPEPDVSACGISWGDCACAYVLKEKYVSVQPVRKNLPGTGRSVRKGEDAGELPLGKKSSAADRNVLEGRKVKESSPGRKSMGDESGCMNGMPSAVPDLDGAESRQSLRIQSGTRAPYNVYNTLSAYAALYAIDAPRKYFGETIRRFDYGNHRESAYWVGGARVQLYLAKNPVGFQQKLFLLGRDPAPKDVLIQINDTKLDGQDVSWLWDVDYRDLARANAVTVTAGGARCEDMALCLKYGDVPCDLTHDIRRTVKELSSTGSKNLYIITNYSGLYSTNRMLEKMQGKRTKPKAAPGPGKGCRRSPMQHSIHVQAAGEGRCAV